MGKSINIGISQPEVRKIKELQQKNHHKSNCCLHQWCTKRRLLLLLLAYLLVTSYSMLANVPKESTVTKPVTDAAPVALGKLLVVLWVFFAYPNFNLNTERHHSSLLPLDRHPTCLCLDIVNFSLFNGWAPF